MVTDLLSNSIQDKFVSYNKNYNRNINFNIIGHISTNSICITSVQVVIYYSVYTHNLDVLKVTQTGWVSKPGTASESIYSASRVHITSSALHEGQFGPWRSSKLNQGQVSFNTSHLMNWEQNPISKRKNLKIKTWFIKIVQVHHWVFSIIHKDVYYCMAKKYNSLCF